LPLPPDTTHFESPPQDSIRSIYALGDFWLCPSLAEGSHLPPLEAMACRTPVISTNVGGPMDILSDGLNGFLIPDFEAWSISQAIEKAFELTHREWQSMSEAAYRTAHSYTWDDATDLFEAALFRAINAPDKRTAAS